MSRKRQDAHQQHVTLEVCGSVLRLVMLRGGSTPGEVTATTQEVPWRHKANSLLSEAGRQELTAAFKQLSAEHKLAGAEINLTLTGAYCVTRVVTGEVADVKREMAELEQRSQLYISLGPGEKALAGYVRQIDARHQHALLTVTNQRILDAVHAASSAVGWQVNRIEPSLFALSRTVRHLKLDQDEPVMVLSLDEKSVEVGIFFKGMLLLDYRPGGKAVHQNVAEIIGKHLPRLKRYCSRYFRFITGTLNKVLVCGEEQDVARVLADFANQDKLTAHSLALDGIATDWNCVHGVPNSPFASAIGSGLGSIIASENEEADHQGPNLLRHLKQQQNSSLSAGARRLAWPVAVAAAVMIVALGLTFQQKKIVNQLEAEVAEFESVRNRAKVLRLTLVQSETKQKLLDRLSYQLKQPDWSKLWTTIGGCMPPNVWGDSFKFENGERISITGTCYTENGVFEFVRWLKQVPELRDVALTSTRPVRHDSKSAINFQLECQLANPADYTEGKD